MCRAIDNEGRHRCNENNPYGVMKRNLQAQKQYHAARLLGQGLTDKQRKKSESALLDATSKIESLNDEKKDLGNVRTYVMDLTPHTVAVLRQLENDGFSPYIVGGSVRDALLGLPSKDIDIEVYGGQADSIIKSLRKLGHVDEVGKSFGVLKIRIDDEDFDVSLPRTDSKIGDGHKGFAVEVNPDLSLEEATARRDYTINALMYSHKLGFIIDKHSGLKDIEAKQLRHVSDAFDEDPLRVLRGVQMASRFGMDLHPDTVEKAKSLRPAFADLATERVQMEFQKLYEKGKRTDKALRLLKETEWDQNFDGLTEINDSKLYRNVRRMQKLIDNGSVPQNKRVALLSATISQRLNPKNRRKFLTTTTVGDKEKNNAFNITELKVPQKQGKTSLRNWSHDMPNNTSIRDWALYEMATGDAKQGSRILAKAEKLGIADSAEKDLVNGENMMAAFPTRKPGPWMKEALTKARKAQYSDSFRTQADGVKWISKNIS
jgi:tRNA nucleotidyltransferase/poly(A) polymerase